MKVTPTFFFEGQTTEHPTFGTPSDYVTEMLATDEGLALIGAFQKLKTVALKRRVVALVEEMADRTVE